MPDRAPPPCGVLVVDKPRGPTSHDVVARLRRLLGTRQVGHAGTLDPMATGVLVVAVGEGTKLVPWLSAAEKEYAATLRLGAATDTLDAEGVVTDRRPLPPGLGEAIDALASGGPAASLLTAAVEAERARREQVPPVFSAVHVDGRRAHELARAGEAPELAPRPVHVERLELEGARAGEAPELALRLAVTKGYYVRSLARDLAARLGTVGHLTSLRRTRSGPFTLADAVSLDGELEPVRARARDAVLPLATAAARALPVVRLTDAGVRAARYGQRVSPADLGRCGPGPAAWLDDEGRLIAVGETDDAGAGRVLRGFPPRG